MEERFKFQFDDYFQRNYDRLVNRSRDVFGRFSFPSSENNSIEKVVANSIENFEENKLNNGTKIRTDAKLFLTLNYANMVYYPLVSVRRENSEFLKQEIYKEVQKILAEAQNETKEITAHKILEAGNRIWDSLRTLGKGSW